MAKWNNYMSKGWFLLGELKFYDKAMQTNLINHTLSQTIFSSDGNIFGMIKNFCNY